MLKLTAAALAFTVMASATAVLAQTTCTECGNTPPPTIVCRGKSDAGIGNGPERFRSEQGDCDPGRSGLHNQAGRNADKVRGTK
jgi:hypothetical protein